jgi:hypothetical protein
MLPHRERSVQPLLRVPIDDRFETVAWTWKHPDGGRSFGFSGMHYHDNWCLRECRRLPAGGAGSSVDLEQPIPKEGLAVEVTAEDLRLPPASPRR